ncbi:hypothetical protein LENED_004607 [Lentinula edodes]|uniref:DUF6533 domain-containing protein n=1 Tax=Lentinula edodes TaxID=5353 RepID=A0A1Q3E6N8_LENED|nr:hypothetical protein LENED_004607 [Lentinula edodes]
MSLLSDIIQDAVKDVYASRYASLAASVIIVYDHLITLDNEFDLIWVGELRSRRFPARLMLRRKAHGQSEKVYSLLIVTIRWPLSLPTTTLSLEQLSLIQGEFSTISVDWISSSSCRANKFMIHFALAAVFAETILQMRLYALYFLNKRILYLMVGSFILTSASAATIMSIAINQFQAETHLLPGLPCVALHVPSYFYSFWIPILAFETLLCILALIRGFRAHTESGYPVRSDSGKRLVSLLIRDSVCYYVVMFATYLTCLLVWVVNIDLLEVPIGFSIAFSCVLGNRVIFNVRKVNQEMKGSSETTTNDGTDKLDSLDDPEPLSDTLTDFEMAQLRSLRAESIEGAHLVI